MAKGKRARQKKRAQELAEKTKIEAAKQEEKKSISTNIFSEIPHWKEQVIEFLPLGVLNFVIYFLTLCRTVPGGDSGELITVSYRLGVAHPPGYPLYTVLGHLMTYLPFGTVAARVNFMSGLFQIAAGFMIFLLMRRWQQNKWLAYLVVGIFSFSPLIWRYSVVAEVFTLNNLFLATLFYILYRFYDEPKQKWLLWFAGVFGLACSHHHTILFYVFPIFLCVTFFHRKLLLQKQTFFKAVGLWTLGFLPYFYLPLASAPLYIFNWGSAHTWEGFKTHFLRSEYGTFQLASGQKDYDNFLFSLSKYSQDLLDQFLVIGVIPIAIACFLIIRDWKKQTRFVKTIFLSTVFYLVVFHVLANMDLSNRLFFDIQSRFWMAPNMVLSFFMGMGLLVIARWAKTQWKSIDINSFLAVVAIVALATQISLHYKMEDYSKNNIFENVGRSMLDSLPQNATFFMRGDIYVNVVRYLQDVEGYRTDISALPYDLLWWPWMKANVEKSLPNVKLPGDVYRYRKYKYGHFNLKDLFDVNITRAPVYIGKLRSDELASIKGHYDIWNIGFVNKVVPSSEPLQFKSYVDDAKGFETYVPPKKEDIRDRSWEAFVYHNYWDREIGRSRQIFSEATKRGNDFEMIRYGAKIMEKVIKHHPTPPLFIYKNLGVAYQFMSRVQPKYQMNMISAWKKYISKKPTKDPDLLKIQRMVASWDQQMQAHIKRRTSSVKEKALGK